MFVSGHSQEAIANLGVQNQVLLEAVPIRLTQQRFGNTSGLDTLVKPILPLGRYLSRIAIRSMEARLKMVEPQLDALLEQ